MIEKAQCGVSHIRTGRTEIKLLLLLLLCLLFYSRYEQTSPTLDVHK